MTAAAPIARFALVYAAGVAVGLMSVPVWVALLAGLLALAAPKRPSGGPLELRAGLIAVGVAGALAGYATPSTDSTTAGGLAVCAVDSVLTGRFLSPPLSESVPLARDDGCGVMTVVLRDMDRGRHSACCALGWQAGSCSRSPARGPTSSVVLGDPHRSGGSRGAEACGGRSPSLGSRAIPRWPGPSHSRVVRRPRTSDHSAYAGPHRGARSRRA